MITWNVPIWVYLWLAGMAGGVYFAALLAERFAGIANGRLLRLATFLGIPLAGIGVLLLILELGNPLRFWHLLREFRTLSAMSLGTWILFAWVVVAGIMAVIWLAELRLRLAESAIRALRQIMEPLSWLGLALSVLLMAYTGALLGTSNQPLWAGTVLLPSLFVVSAVSTGVALLVLAAVTVPALRIPSGTVGRLAEADAVLILVELVVLVTYAIWLTGSGLVGAGEALRLLVMDGVLAAPFWAGVILLGLLIPLALDLVNWGKEIRARGMTWLAVAASSLCVLMGGLILRAVIVIGGQL